MFAREADDERQNVPRDPADHERTEDDGDGAQSFDERQNVPRDPADHERAEDDGDGAQSFASPVVVARQLLQSLPLRISHHTHTYSVISRPCFNKSA